MMWESLHFHYILEYSILFDNFLLVISNLSEAAHAGQLKICHISKSTSSVDGKTEVTLLCDKVQKGNYVSYATSRLYYASFICFYTSNTLTLQKVAVSGTHTLLE